MTGYAFSNCEGYNDDGDIRDFIDFGEYYDTEEMMTFEAKGVVFTPEPEVTIVVRGVEGPVEGDPIPFDEFFEGVETGRFIYNTGE